MRTVEDIRADVGAGRLSRLFAIGEIRDLTGCSLTEAVRALDGARVSRTVLPDHGSGEGPPPPTE